MGISDRTRTVRVGIYLCGPTRPYGSFFEYLPLQKMVQIKRELDILFFKMTLCEVRLVSLLSFSVFFYVF